MASSFKKGKSKIRIILEEHVTQFINMQKLIKNMKDYDKNTEYSYLKHCH